MIKKRSIWETTKIVTDALRGGRKTWTELKKLGIPEKTLDRILNVYLGKDLGLVTKSEEYWVWYDEIRTFQSKADYDLAIDHSRKLIPAFKTWISEEGKDPTLLFAAIEHLKSYPAIYQRYKEFTSLLNDRLIELLKKYKFPGRGILISGRPLSPVEIKEIEELRNLVDDTKMFDKKLELYRQFAGDILLLIFKVEVGGTPLEGKCDLCPRVKVTTNGV